MESKISIVKDGIAEALSSFRLRLRLLKVKDKNCKRCCLWCEHCEECACELLGCEVEYKGYIVFQSGLNNHISIYDEEGQAVYHAQNTKKNSEEELKKYVDYYLSLIEEMKNYRR